MISYEQKEKKFNFRVGGILESPDRKKVLIHRLSNFNFWLLPGGRVEMLEDTENAILREIQEELGVTSEIDRLVSITESFFDMKDKTYHELGFNYLLIVIHESDLVTNNTIKEITIVCDEGVVIKGQFILYDKDLNKIKNGKVVINKYQNIIWEKEFEEDDNMYYCLKEYYENLNNTDIPKKYRNRIW